jgi:hypothetical protein
MKVSGNEMQNNPKINELQNKFTLTVIFTKASLFRMSSQGHDRCLPAPQPEPVLEEEESGSLPEVVQTRHGLALVLHSWPPAFAACGFVHSCNA